jgi:hypothetical protein
VSTTEIAKLLAESEDRHGVGVSLSAADGRAIYAGHADLGAGAEWRGDAGYGLILRVRFPETASPLRLGAIVLGGFLFGGLVLAVGAGVLRPRRRRDAQTVIS